MVGEFGRKFEKRKEGRAFFQAFKTRSTIAALLGRVCTAAWLGEV